jgi:endogenous inhibitor of DNA gyrase (YacG/DUF329 family)
MNVRCPTCKRTGDWFAGETGPFCSRRCKLIDLGKWFSEEHAISEPLPMEEAEALGNESSTPVRNAADEHERDRRN